MRRSKRSGRCSRWDRIEVENGVRVRVHVDGHTWLISSERVDHVRRNHYHWSSSPPSRRVAGLSANCHRASDLAGVKSWTLACSLAYDHSAPFRSVPFRLHIVRASRRFSRFAVDRAERSWNFRVRVLDDSDKNGHSVILTPTVLWYLKRFQTLLKSSTKNFWNLQI